ncbi:hypothetical protein [Sphingomonas sp. PAMC 26617]|uniref:hypothetical protein n=1 Tax=Sphingomonas sp. PAMC 26617 TaxID=1112216 RepID=UPI000289B250|nr:hypothetical protein [Sphingomonas sp. PAMC 26617]
MLPTAPCRAHEEARPALINLALQVPGEAVARHPADPITNRPVQLALRTLYPYLRDLKDLTRFWQDVGRTDPISLSSRRGDYAAISTRLVALGFEVDA